MPETTGPTLSTIVEPGRGLQLPRTSRVADPLSRLALGTAFFLSGAAALLYQIVWQRVLFTVYGLDSASVTIVVTAFMLGLGLGSLAGGALSTRRRDSGLLLFALFELGIGFFGWFSLPIFSWVASFTLGSSHLTTGLVTFLLVVVPTTLMGGTLPLLVGHMTRRSRNVGKTVSTLYFANTLGAALGCFAVAGFTLGSLGLAGSVRLAAGLNLALGVVVLACALWQERPTAHAEEASA